MLGQRDLREKKTVVVSYPGAWSHRRFLRDLAIGGEGAFEGGKGSGGRDRSVLKIFMVNFHRILLSDGSAFSTVNLYV